MSNLSELLPAGGGGKNVEFVATGVQVTELRLA